jgi:outer membrane protein TolC
MDLLPAVRVQQAVVDEDKAAVSSAASALFPTFSVNYSRGVQDSSEFPTSNPYWTFTGLLSYPLFAGGPTVA